MIRSLALYLLLAFSLSCGFLSSQINIDSLVRELELLPNDTSAIIRIGAYAQEQAKISHDAALAAYGVALKKSRAINNQKYIAQSLTLLGSIYTAKSDFPNASLHLNEAERIAIRLGDKKMLLKIKMSVGNMYSYSHQTAKAKEIYLEGLKLCGDQPSAAKATILNNLGGLMYRESNLEPEKVAEAGRYILKAVAVLEEIKSDDELINKYSNLGLIYCDLQKYDSALYFLSKAKKLIDVDQLPDNLITYYSYMGRIYADKKDFESAEKYYLLSLEESKKLNSPDWIAETYLSLSDLYDAKQDFKTSLDYFRKFHYLSDSLVNTTNFKAAADIQNKFEREKKEAELSKLKAEQSRNRIINIAMIAVSFLLVISGIMMYSRFKIKALSEKKLKQQNEIISQKNKDITDSINYSRKIQDAILPATETISKLFPENFILYKPKDIISGDFYWCAQKDNYKFFAVADCTGHGVPGALMSMLGTSLLKEIILTKNILDTGKILNELRTLVIQALGNNSGNKDGMDIALLRYSEETGELQFSGANNSVLLIKENQVNELKADKQPIGLFDRMSDFTSHNVKLTGSTTVYLYTDGYADQFGGEKGKKYKYRQLDDLILQNTELSMKEQQALLARSFENWKGRLEQVDDVCVAAVKLNA